MNFQQKTCRYLVEVNSLHQSPAAEVSKIQEILPLVFDVIDAILNLLRPKVVGLDEAVTDLQYCRQVRVTGIQLILVRLHPNN